jgi:DNA-binding MarR family transcriptional regulator
MAVAPPQRKGGVLQEPFPPLSTSLETFLKDGSDRDFRRLIYDLTSLFNIMVRNRRHFGAYIGVTESQALMMMLIAETPGVTVGHIAQHLDVSSQFVTIQIGDLVKTGVVEKRPNEADRRSMFLSLTSKGESLLRELAPLRRRTNDTMFRSLTEQRANALKEILRELISDGRVALHDLEAPHFDKKAPTAR